MDRLMHNITAARHSFAACRSIRIKAAVLAVQRLRQLLTCWLVVLDIDLDCAGMLWCLQWEPTLSAFIQMARNTGTTVRMFEVGPGQQIKAMVSRVVKHIDGQLQNHCITCESLCLDGQLPVVGAKTDSVFVLGLPERQVRRMDGDAWRAFTNIAA